MGRHGKSARSLLSKLLTATDETKWQKEELLQVIFVQKVLTAVVYAGICGLVPITGASGILGYLILSFLGSWVLYHSWLKVDEEEFGGHAILINEGMPTGFAMFVLTWTLTYTSMHA